MAKEMLINVAEGEECRIAVLRDGVLDELYMERASSGSHVGNVYKGRVTNVEPAIQAAFVDFGAPKNGFLHISDVQPKYFPKGQRSSEAVGKKRSRRDRPPIQECLRRGQEVVVQVIKEGIGTKGPTLTTYLSIPGRFLVMMPGMERMGVSRKIEEEDVRRKLRALLEELNPPDTFGFIVRTAALEHPKKEVQNDYNYLMRIWSSIERRLRETKAPAELYQESDLVIRTIRDIYTAEVERIVCDNEWVSQKIVEFLSVIMPRGKHEVKYYPGPTPLFHYYGLEEEIEKIYSRRVELRSGGSIVIDQTEALVAIDVNSGRFRDSKNSEDTALKTNLAAAAEVARQLRLRDMGGMVVVDFIDMRDDKHCRQVEKALRDGVKDDRARTKILKMSAFGMVQMTRQRVRQSLQTSIYRECAHCRGAGLIKSDESLALDVMRNLQLACTQENIATVELVVAPAVSEYLNNRRRMQLAHLERAADKKIIVRGDPNLAGDQVVFHATDSRGSQIVWNAPLPGRQGPTAGPDSGRVQLVDVADLQAPQQPEEELDALEESEAPAIEPAPALAERAPSMESYRPQALPTGQPTDGQPAGTEEGQPRKRRRRRGGRRRRHKGEPQGAEAQQGQSAEGPSERQAAQQAATGPEAQAAAEHARPEGPAESAPQAAAKEPADEHADEQAPSAKKRPRRRRRRGGKKTAEQAAEAQAQPTEAQAERPQEPAPTERPQEPVPAEHQPSRFERAPEPVQAQKTPEPAEAAPIPAKVEQAPQPAPAQKPAEAPQAEPQQAQPPAEAEARPAAKTAEGAPAEEAPTAKKAKKAKTRRRTTTTTTRKRAKKAKKTSKSAQDEAQAEPEARPEAESQE